VTSELLTVAALPTAAEAEIVRGRLREAGVEAVLVEPDTAADSPLPARVHVQVTPADFDRAMRVVFPIPLAVGRRSAAVGSGPTELGSRQQAAGSEETEVGSRQQAAGSEGTEVGSRQQAAGSEGTEVGSRQQAAGSEETVELEAPPAREEFPDPRPPNPDPYSGPRPINPDPWRIVVPAMEFIKSGSRIKTIEPTALTDRAAKRAWWCAVAGVGVCPLLLYATWWTAVIAALALPALGYSICVVHSIGLRNQPLSRTGERHFYGALGLIALFAVLLFASMAMRQ
jgi:hypothetical protein